MIKHTCDHSTNVNVCSPDILDCIYFLTIFYDLLFGHYLMSYSLALDTYYISYANA